MKYHALFVNFEKAAKFEIVFCCKIIGGALWVNGGFGRNVIRMKNKKTEHFSFY